MAELRDPPLSGAATESRGVSASSYHRRLVANPELRLAIAALGRRLRRLPQRVGKDPDRATRRADVFDLPTRHPVVNRSAAHTHYFAGLHDRESLSFEVHFVPPEKTYRKLLTEL